MTGGTRFVRACLRKPVDRTPVWFLRQAGRYMPEYQAVRRHHSLLEICKQPKLAAEVTITAAEKLDVDAAIIFADLLLPFECMGLDFEFQAGEGPVIHKPVRTVDDVARLRTDRASELGYVAEAIARVVAHFKDRLGIIGFCGAPFTLASYMIEGGGSRNYVHTKTLMYRETRCVAQTSGQAGCGPARVRAPAGRGRRGRDPGLRQLGRRPERRRLPRLRASHDESSHSGYSGDGRAGDLLRGRHGQPAAGNA